MRFACMRIGAAIAGVAVLIAASNPAFAQGTEPKPPDPRPPGESPKDPSKKIDEYAEAAQRLGGGAAANPECMWLGQRFVSLLWRDDLDTAFRHLDLYDRFGCPSGHIQTTFRCVLRKTKIDPKAEGVLNAEVYNCWLKPDSEPATAPGTAASVAAPAQAQ
jgi:hypothetical protein